MRSFEWLSAVLVISGLGYGVAAQEPRTDPSGLDRHAGPTFRAATSLVAINVTVTNGSKLVTGLSRDQFVVYEDGRPQEVQFFESTQVPIDLILLLDTSSSMQHRMPTVHKAATEFMKILRPGDRGAVVAFNDHVKVMQDLTSDSKAIAAAIAATSANGSTALHNALYVSLKEFGRRALSAGDVRRQTIAVLSDGEDTASVISFDDVVSLARTMGVNVYTIALQSSGAEPASTIRYGSRAARRLHELARETGAQAFYPAGIDELRSVYGAIAAELAAQYSIGYLPANDRTDGRFRQIRVSIPANPEFRPRTRTGYTVGAANATVDSPSTLR